MKKGALQMFSQGQTLVAVGRVETSQRQGRRDVLEAPIEGEMGWDGGG